MRTCFLIAIIQSAFLISIGFIFGHTYLQIEQYLNIYAKVILVATLILIGYFAFSKIKSKVSQRIQ